ncbi:hypothetical protein [Pseudomonas sp. DP16D-R1]|nr:hypothetical protein [Pseudomonas sp. DP16D-R1]
MSTYLNRKPLMGESKPDHGVMDHNKMSHESMDHDQKTKKAA